MASFMPVVDTVLRVPALYIVDEFLQSRLGHLGVFPSSLLPMHREADFDYVTGEKNHTLARDESRTSAYDPSYFGKMTTAHEAVVEFNLVAQYMNSHALDALGPFLETSVQLMLLTIVLLVSMFLMSLWTKHLLSLYKYLLAVFFVLASYKLNVWVAARGGSAPACLELAIVQCSKEVFSLVFKFLFTTAIQMSIATGFSMCVQPASFWLGQLLVLNFAVPTFFLMLPLPAYLLDRLPFTLSVVPATFLFLELATNGVYIHEELKSRIEFVVVTAKTEGLLTLLNIEWTRLDVSSVVRMFWVVRMGLLACVYFMHPTVTYSHEDLVLLLKILLVRCCETLPALLGLASIFSWLWSWFHQLCQAFLLVTNEDDSPHVGPVSAILFIIISLQNGVSNLKPTSRLVRLFRSICLLVACLLHFIHNAVDPVLMSLAASANPVITRHLRALAVSTGLVAFTVCSITVLWATHGISTWMLAVTGFSVEVISKVFISLALYGLFLCDAKKNQFWAQLDDHVYRVRLVGRTVEFLVGIFLLCNSAFILLYECGGAIRAVLVGLHAYFNLWCEARAGWAVFTRRRDAVRKICSLRTADATDNPEDVCAICFNQLQQLTETIKVTPCRHYFHAVCLRKWLYMQERCPMCHQTLWPSHQLEQQYEQHGQQLDHEHVDN